MLCPPNQTAYVRRDKGAIIGDACGFYEAFSFRPAEGVGEKPDHIVSQLEFASILLVMLHGADSPERRDVVTRALSDFAEAHPGEWIEAFAARLESVTELALYGAVARALRELWKSLAEQHSLRHEPAGPGYVAAQEPDEPYECGLAPSLAAPVTLNVPVRAAGRASPATCA
jgi:TorA maturation chaperone TorD